ncbi:MAG: response regulator transcription factor [Desulfuromonadaceae bacterium]
MAKIRLLIIDDHPIICESLEFLLNQDPGLLVLGSAVDVLKGLAMVRKWRPDLVVLDISMPGYNGMEAISFYRDAHPQIKIVIFSARCEEKYVHQSLRAGANGYVLKGAAPTEPGGSWLSPQFNQRIIAS